MTGAKELKLWGKEDVDVRSGPTQEEALSAGRCHDAYDITGGTWISWNVGKYPDGMGSRSRFTEKVIRDVGG